MEWLKTPLTPIEERDMTEKINTLAKISMLPKILESASFLKKLGLIDGRPEDLVKRYIDQNPDINEYMGKVSTD